MQRQGGKAIWPSTPTLGGSSRRHCPATPRSPRVSPCGRHRHRAQALGQVARPHRLAEGVRNRRALVKADISRWKRVIGDDLRSQTEGHQPTEVAIAADALNRMSDRGSPKGVYLA
jgi:hypothetical protein